MRRLPRTTYLVDFFLAATLPLRLTTVLRTDGVSSSTLTERRLRTDTLGSSCTVRLWVSTPTPMRVLPSVRVRVLVLVSVFASALASAFESALALAPCCELEPCWVLAPWFCEPAACPLVSPTALFWPWAPALSCDVAVVPEEPEDPVLGLVVVWA